MFGQSVFVSTMVDSEVATLAYVSCVEFSFFVLAASGQFHAASFVIAIFAKSFRVKLGISMLTLCYLANLFAIGALFNYQ